MFESAKLAGDLLEEVLRWRSRSAGSSGLVDPNREGRALQALMIGGPFDFPPLSAPN